MSRRLITIAIGLVSLVFIINILQSIYTLWQKGSIVSEREDVKQELEAENAELKKRLAEAESQEFIEFQAREKLNLQREGEVVVVLPKNLSRDESQAEVNAQAETNWQRWLELFF